MKLKVLGAAGEVTGSNYLVQAGNSSVLIDCGLHQGRDEERKNREPFQFNPSDIDAVLLTHAHIDHSGRIPLLYRQGFKGKVKSTLPTSDLVEVLWKDSAHLMSEEAKWRSRKNARKNLPPVEPLFTDTDVEKAIQYLDATSYDDVIEVAPGVRARFRDAGHILGSAVLELFLNEEGQEIKLVFSGDLGPNYPVMGRNPAFIEDADYVVIESTYGDRVHKTNDQTREEFRQVMGKALKDRSRVMIPTFVVDRAQRIFYELMLMQEEGLLRDNVPIYFDSPMGVKATEIYNEYPALFSSEVQSHIRKGSNPFSPEHLNFVQGVEESRAINEVKHAIILAGSGMCNGGRIVHHMKHGIWDKNNHLIFVGYQARGTLGRRIVEGAKTARIAGEEVSVRAQIHTINGFSAHADRNDLLTWASNFKTNPSFFITHGEEKSSKALAELFEDKGIQAYIPVVNQEFNLVPEREIPAKYEKVVPVAPLEKENELNVILSDISILAENLRLKKHEFEDTEQLKALLRSSKVLLETVENQVSSKK